ncbi:MAG: sulfotransferase family protein [Phycisphaeraceae bacterium]
MTLPNFLLFGAGKAGTTSVYHYLEQHPDVYMCPVKEPRYFAYDASRHDGDPELLRYYKYRTREQYEKLFDGAGQAKAIGEGSIQYLACPDAAERIKALIPDVRLIAILREPAERAFSSYMMYVRDGYEKRTFAQAIEDELRGETWKSPFPWLSYLRPGQYGQELKLYYDVFDREQVFVALYEDLRADPMGLMRRIYGFIGVDEGFTPETGTVYNASGVPRNKLMARLMRKNAVTTRLRRVLPSAFMSRIDHAASKLASRNLVKVDPEPQTMSRLRRFYAPDIQVLSALLARDLSSWIDDAMRLM